MNMCVCINISKQAAQYNLLMQFLGSESLLIKRLRSLSKQLLRNFGLFRQLQNFLFSCNIGRVSEFWWLQIILQKLELQRSLCPLHSIPPLSWVLPIAFSELLCFVWMLLEISHYHQTVIPFPLQYSPLFQNIFVIIVCWTNVKISSQLHTAYLIKCRNLVKNLRGKNWFFLRDNSRITCR